MAETQFDCAIIGAGILGLAHALAASRAGLRAVVLERDARAVGASIRNFGFVTVTGQERGDCWRRARRARDVWAEVAPQAGIAIHQRGLVVAARRPEALAVLEEFAAGPMGEGCRLLRAAEAARLGGLRGDLRGAMHSPHELRVESRDAIPQSGRLAGGSPGRGLPPRQPRCMRWSRAGCGPCRRQHRGAAHHRLPRHRYPHAVPRRSSPAAPSRCASCTCCASPPPAAPCRAPVMSDLGLARYLGYADCPNLPAWPPGCAPSRRAELDNGIHLIVVQGADGSLVVGDSHHYSPTPDPFQPAAVDALILQELSAVLDLPRPEVVERWVGGLSLGPGDRLLRAADAGREAGFRHQRHRRQHRLRPGGRRVRRSAARLAA